MAPVVPTLTLLLAAISAVDAAPPGRHAPPSVANLISNTKRGLHSFVARWYYGDAHGLVSQIQLLIGHCGFRNADHDSRAPLLYQRNDNSLCLMAGATPDV